MSAPEDEASCFSQIFYIWVWDHVISPAYSRGGLRARDLPSHSSHDSADGLRSSFEDRIRTLSNEDSLFVLLFQLHWFNISVSGLLCLLWLGVSWCIPFVLEILLESIEGTRDLSDGAMWAMAVSLWLGSSLQSLLAHHFWTFGERAGKHMQM